MSSQFQMIKERFLFALPYLSILLTGLALLGLTPTAPIRLRERPLFSQFLGSVQLLLLTAYFAGILGNHYVKVYSTFLHLTSVVILPFLDMNIWWIVVTYFWFPQIAYLIAVVAFTSISEIVPGVLYLGNAKAATQSDVLKKYNIKRVIELHDGNKTNNLKDVDAELLQLLCSDDIGSNKDGLLNVAPKAAVAANTKQQNGAALIHCSAGVSRSPAVVVYWLLSTHKCQTVDEAYALVRSKRPVVDVRSDHMVALQNHFQKAKKVP